MAAREPGGGANEGTGRPPSTRARRSCSLAGTLEVTQVRRGDQVDYVFAVKLTESEGVPATVTAVWIVFDAGYGGECSFDAASLGQARVPANGTLALNPLTCPSYWTDSYAEVSLSLTDDNGYKLDLYLWWAGKL